MAANKRIVTTVVIVVALLAVGALGYWWGQTQANNNQPAAKQETSKDDSDTPPVENQPQKLTVYYVALSDAGSLGEEIGCGDSIVATDTEPMTTSDKVESAMKELLANHEMNHGQRGLYNALYQSRLTYESSEVVKDTVKVELAGTLVQGGTCDSPRIQAQLEETAMAAAGVTKAAITVNGTPLDEVLSTK